MQFLKVLLFITPTLFAIQSETSFKVPPLRGPVNDYADMIDNRTELQLNHALRVLKKQSGGTELAVLTVPSLEGNSLEQASFDIVDHWKIGSEEKDNGVLLFIAKKERRIRIEVGQGHEGTLTDAYAKRIIDEAMVPMMRSGDSNGAILVGVFQIIRRIHPEINMEPLLGQKNMMQRRSHRRESLNGLHLLFLIIFLIFFGRGGFLGFLIGSSLGRNRYYGGGFGGGGFGGGGFGGGFGGGGGGFSGGGASGGW